MARILPLDESTYNKIAAGEVVDRPASILKELVENSIDAGAARITINISQGGTGSIKVTDDGSGMDREDAVSAFMPHHTSKIRRIEDLDTLFTLGFRGEALSSIAAVSRVEMLTRQASSEDDEKGVKIVIQGGKIESISTAACREGTSITVTDLFYNTPARFKFLKRNATEAGYCFDNVTRLALGNPNICFDMASDAGSAIRVPGDGSMESAIYGIYGKDIANNINKIEYLDKGVKISGYAGMPGSEKANRSYQSFYVNGRFFRSKLITAAIDQAYRSLIVKGRYPFILLFMEMPPATYDVNVHPQKAEVRFSDEKAVFRDVYHAINNAVSGNILPLHTVHASGDSFGIGHDRTEREQGNLYIMDRVSEYTAEAASEKQTGSEAQSTGMTPTPAVTYGRPFLRNARIIGRLFSTYILLESDECFYMVDQHAAHERIVFERLKRRRERRVNTTISQPLAVPAVMQLTPAEMTLAEDESGFFESLGFNTDWFGGNSIIIREVPYEGGTDNPADMYKAVLDGLEERHTSHISHDHKEEFRYEKAMYSLACKIAIKANDRIDETGIKMLLEDLDKLDNPYTCPHGRPSVIVMRKSDIEIMFKRRQV